MDTCRREGKALALKSAQGHEGSGMQRTDHLSTGQDRDRMKGPGGTSFSPALTATIALFFFPLDCSLSILSLP